MAGDPFADEARVKKPASHEIGQDLAALSLHELDERVALLEEEIARIRAARGMKEASLQRADTFFKR